MGKKIIGNLYRDKIVPHKYLVVDEGNLIGIFYADNDTDACNIYRREY